MQMAKIDLDALKREATSISATRATPKRPSEELKSLSIQWRDEAERIVGETLAKAGVNVAEFREKISKNNRTLRDAAKGLQKPRSETVAKRRIAFQNSIAHRRAALEPLGNVPTAVQTSMVYLPEPFFITVSPNSSYSFLVATNVAPYDSRAQIVVPPTDYGHNVYCDFWFEWFNDSALQAVVTNASSQTVLNGGVYASISGPPTGLLGTWEGFKFSSGSEITVYQGNTVAVSVAVPDETFDLKTHAEPTDHGLNFEYETLTPSTSGWPIVVPPQTGILIQVAPYISWDFSSGFAWWGGPDEGDSANLFTANFNDVGNDGFMQCSGVALEIQSPIISYPAA
jgi:hypothetical protein